MSADLARFFRKVTPDGSGCWVWSGCNSDGYGNFNVEGTVRGAHRWLYRQLVACPLPGFVLDHLCRSRACVNPAHLEIVSHRENILRGVGATAVNHGRTDCIRGHELAGANLYVDKRGHRNCRACHAIKERERYAAKVATGWRRRAADKKTPPAEGLELLEDSRVREMLVANRSAGSRSVYLGATRVGNKAR